MKKTMKFLALAAAGAILFSCGKEEAVTSEPVVENPAGEQPQPGSEDEPAAPAVDGNLLTSFGAVIEGQNDTRVSVDINRGETDIEEGDEALVFVSEGNRAVYVYDGFQFTLKSGQTPVSLTASASVYYPANEFEVDGDVVKLVMPGAIESSGDFGAINPMAGMITETDGNYSVELKNLISVLRVKVTADVNITSVLLNFGVSNKFAEGAKFTVNAAESTLTFSDASGASGTTVTLATPATSADVLFLLPTVALPDGLEIMANLAGNHNGGVPIYTIKNTSTAAPERNKIKEMSFYAGLFSGGEGTSENPYKIANARDFRNLIKYSTAGYTEGGMAASAINAAYYQQTADIDFKGVKMSPVGDNSNRFSGHYDGNNKELQNVKIEETGQYAAVFAAVVSGGFVKNLTVSGTITKTETTDNSLAGGIVGLLADASEVSGCTNNATITSSASYTGGIVARLYNSSKGITDCTNNGSVSSTEAIIGGIVGQHINGGTITGCYNTGTVSGTQAVGGIVGEIGRGGGAPTDISFIYYSRNNATVNASANCSGGIAGRVYGGSVIGSCFAKGTLASESYDVGGIAGLVQVNNSDSNSRIYIFDCLTGMNVSTTRNGDSNDMRTGGAFGYATNNQSQYIAIDNCGVVATSVTVGGGKTAGGFIGMTSSTNKNTNRFRIRNCYTMVSSITGAATEYGGFVGNAKSYGELHHCYYVANDSNTVISANVTKEDLAQKTALEIASATTCDTFNANNYVLTIGSTNYGSSLGWAIPADCNYPVPGSLINKGEEYYK